MDTVNKNKSKVEKQRTLDDGGKILSHKIEVEYAPFRMKGTIVISLPEHLRKKKPAE